MSSRIPAIGVAVILMSAATHAHARQSDPYIWLEDVESPRALEWVESRNAATVAELSRHPAYQPIFDRAMQILDSDDRIAYPSILGDRLYNFWQDEANPRGLWRRATWDSYVGDSPVWETVLDIDALAAAEGVPWAFGGASCLPPDYRRCLMRLSRGGADAVEVREFDMQSLEFIAGGFTLPEAKQSVAWVDANTLLVATDFGEGTMSGSGYPRIAKLWRRGTSLSEAATAFEAGAADMGVFVGVERTATRTYRIVSHRIDFYSGTTNVLHDGAMLELDVPADADPSFHRDRLLVYVRSPWEIGGRSYAAGSLLSIDYDAFRAGSRNFEVVVAPGARETISSVQATRDFVLVAMLSNVRGELRRYRYDDGVWTFETVPAPAMGSIDVVAVTPESNRYFFTYSGYTQPNTLYLAGTDGAVHEIRRLPAMFDAEGLVVTQHEATSPDGTRIPYFTVQRSDIALDGSNPTLLYAYGGFEVSMTPGYSPVSGAAWLERGGVYVVANIRGGGEFGPAWHRAALKENRQRAFDDFIAVAEDLVARNITSARHLGIMGGSNGGLLVGVAFTQRPELFNAVVVQVPLLDMRRYSQLLAGASWMAEYGNPDVAEEWAYISRYSPYQNLRSGVTYPEVLFTTTTRDDRVHPGHARKMAARMESMDLPFFYFENTEGGHGSGVTSEQRARTTALTYAYLWRKLGAERGAL